MSLATSAPGRALLAPARTPGALPWLIAATAFLAVLGLAAALALAGAARTLAAAGAGRYTIELPDGSGPAADRLLVGVRRLADVARAERVAPGEIARLVAPVLGPDAAGLPLPVLIDVTLAPGAVPGPLATLVRAVPGAALVPAADGLAPLAALVGTLRRLALAVALLAGGVTLMVAVLAARAMLAAHGPTLAILHALGATDRDMAALVQRRTGLDALLGGAVGLAAAAVAVGIVAGRYASLGLLAPKGVALGAGGLALLALVPLALAGAATLAARIAVLVALARQP